MDNKAYSKNEPHFPSVTPPRMSPSPSASFFEGRGPASSSPFTRQRSSVDAQRIASEYGSAPIRRMSIGGAWRGEGPGVEPPKPRQIPALTERKISFKAERNEATVPSLLNLFTAPPNFGSHQSLFLSNELKQRKALSGVEPVAVVSSVRKKKIFLQLTLVFGLLLMASVVVDYVYIVFYEEPSLTTNWLIMLLVVQVGSFCSFLLAFIYANEAGDIRNLNLSIMGGGLNLVAFIMRISYEIAFLDYRP